MRKLIPLLLILLSLEARLQAQCNAAFTVNQNGNDITASASHNSPGWNHYWQFGDGQQGWGHNAWHTYTAAGTYTIKHIVTDSLNTCRDSATQTVTISTITTCKARFTYKRDSLDPFIYRFSSTSNGGGSNIVSYNWTLNGNHFSSAAAFTDTLAPGNNMICLTINTAAGCTASWCDSVVVVDTPYNCDLNPGFQVTIDGATVHLQAVDTRPGIQHSWYLGEGSFRYGRNVSYTYDASGTYILTHAMYDSIGHCADTAAQNVTITGVPLCKSAFTYRRDSVHLNNYYFQYYGTAPRGAMQTYRWTVNGQIASSYGWSLEKTFTAGVHTICLQVTSSNGCVDNFCDSIVVGPAANCALNPSFIVTTDHEEVNVRANDSTPGLMHNFWFGDGISIGGRNATHSYNAPGTYVIKHIVTNTATLCSDSAMQTVTITMAPNCKASFSVARDSVDTQKFYFYNISTSTAGSIVAYQWRVNGTIVSTAPSMTYTLMPGRNGVGLRIITSQGCISNKVDSIFVSADSLQNNIVSVPTFPNPAEDSFVNFQLNMEQTAQVNITVYNSFGLVVHKIEQRYNEGFNRVSIPVEKLRKGQYFIDIQYGNVRKRSRFVKF